MRFVWVVPDLPRERSLKVREFREKGNKPAKYPDMFRVTDLMLLNKCDLLPCLAFDMDKPIAFARQDNPELRIIRTSATSGTFPRE